MPRKEYPPFVKIAARVIRQETGLALFDLPREEQFKILLAALAYEHEPEWICYSAIIAAWEQMRDTRRDRRKRWGRLDLPAY